MGFLKALQGMTDLHSLEPLRLFEIVPIFFLFSSPGELLAELLLHLLLCLHQLLRQLHLGENFHPIPPQSHSCALPRHPVLILFTHMLRGVPCQKSTKCTKQASALKGTRLWPKEWFMSTNQGNLSPRKGYLRDNDCAPHPITWLLQKDSFLSDLGVRSMGPDVSHSKTMFRLNWRDSGW